MINKLISSSVTDPTIVDEVRDATQKVTKKIESSSEKIIAATRPTIIVNSGGALDAETSLLIDNTLSREYFNLFVVKNMRFDGNQNCFSISVDKALQHMSSQSHDIFDESNKTLTSLFVTANDGYKQCKAAHQMFYYGFVSSIELQSTQILIVYKKLFSKPMSQQKLNEISFSIGINCDDGIDFLDETNWVIKKADIRRVLIENGIEYK